MAAEPERTVIVKADKDVPFGFFVRVMDLSREVGTLGALNLTISTTIPDDSILSLAGENIRP
jgi:biopolymer transport protein ExbD